MPFVKFQTSRVSSLGPQNPRAVCVFPGKMWLFKLSRKNIYRPQVVSITAIFRFTQTKTRANNK